MRSVLVLSLCIGCSGSAAPTPPATSTSVGEIIGGRSDDGHTYVVGVGDTSGAFCSGTVISAHTVITAGHCFTAGQTNGGITRVFFGPVVDPPSKAQKTIVVAQAIRDPGFDDNTLTDDLTIIQLSQPAPVQSAPLLREDMDDNPGEFVGPSFTWAGYGVNNGTAQSGFGTRRVVTFPIAALGPATVGGSVGTIDATQFYYDTPGKNTCNGDSGGPAFAIRNGVEHHAGTTSFGDGPCKLDGVQQRTDAPNIAAFIQAHIDSFEANDPCRSDGVCNEACQDGQTELVDPDCAENHCGSDGICALSCVAPLDPDCAGLTDHCAVDGVCDPTCASLDPDCTAQCGSDGTCVPKCPVRDPDCGPPGGCGDGVLDTGEQCDDGNAIDSDGCKNDCTLAACGDGVVETGVEDCDDGNAIDTDACTNNCTVARCGDGVVEAGVEDCDDGNSSDTDACLSDCTAARCGDGIVEVGVEDCDDGNTTAGDGCDPTCHVEAPAAVCGNGVVDAGEDCDDGNTIDGDGCSASCMREMVVSPLCGNGIVEGDEQCDDGNHSNGDGCDHVCQLETGMGGCATTDGGSLLVPLLGFIVLHRRRRYGSR